MSEQVHTTFEGLSHTQFVQHADTMLSNSKTMQSKQHAIAYLNYVASLDKKIINAERKKNQTKSLEQRKRQQKITDLHDELEFDFSKNVNLFSAQTLSDQDMTDALAQDRSHVFIGGKNYLGDIHVSGDFVTLDGEGLGSAVSETLQNSGSVVGKIHITGDNCIVRNVDFISSGEKAVTFGGAANVTFDSCSFVCGPNINDSKWFFGDGIAEGNLTIKNCLVTGFNSWYLADASTHSSAATVKLHSVRIENNYFKNNHGCFAIRGPTSTPNDVVEIIGNKFSTDVLHTQFWDFIEVSGGVRQVVCTDNAFIHPIGSDTAVGKKGACQIWSQSPVPWTLNYKNNTAENVKVVLKIAHNAGFYAPNSHDPNHKIDLSGLCTNIAYAFTPVYKKADGSTVSDMKWQEGDYVPENVVLFPNVPTAVNPHNYNIVQKSN
jgi:hypothetical protein